MLRPIFKCHGGKYYLQKWIISHFPKNYENLKYIEGCGGAASVLLNKEPSFEEVYNDADHNIAGIVKCLVEGPDEFLELLDHTEYCEDQFLWSKGVSESGEGTNRYVAELVRRRFSRGGLRQAFAWSNRERGGQPGDVNAWQTYLRQLPAIIQRLSNVKVYCMPVDQLFAAMDGEDVLWYIDPPYLPLTRQANNVYTVEMTEADHIALAEMLNKAKGKVILSGYQSPLYNKRYSSWNLKCKPITNHSSQKEIKQKRIECLWMNY